MTRFEAMLGIFPRWKTTPELAELVERTLKNYTPEQVKYAAGQQRLERKSEDPDIGAIKSRLAGVRVGDKGDKYHAAGRSQADEYNNRPYTDDDRRWDALCESWRSDLKTAMQAPDFTPTGWARSAYPLFRRDIADFGHTSKSFATAYLCRIARDCGVRLEIKGSPEAKTLAGMVTEVE
ncbi:MAG: hypothetical protein KF805_12555 [Phycisphaeraceae bacterium]|nr:hypothetical protein [Phycisphaeraceae bacterium]